MVQQLVNFTFSEYEEQSQKTAIYPKNKAYQYLFLGLISEIGELAGVLKKFIREDFNDLVLRKRLCSEMGDCWWYLAQIHVALFKVSFDTSNIKCDKTDMLIPPETYVFDKIMYLTNKSLELSNQYRQEKDSSIFMDTYQELFYTFYCLGIYLGEEPQVTWQNNISKLLNRKNNSTLRGDGEIR